MSLVRVKVRGLMIDERTKSPIVVLQDQDGEDILPIWIGEAEARAVGIVLADEEPDRPLTHDLMLTMLKAVGAKVASVHITDLTNNTFFAEIHLEIDGKPVLIDARPSDSIALALRAKADIFVAQEVMESGHGGGWKAKKVVKTDEEKAAELRKFLENLDPGDFGKFGL